VSHDSRAVSPGQLYAALPGSNVHGAKFAPELIRSGVDAILTDAAGWELITEALSGSEDDRARLETVAALIVDAPRAVLGFVSAAVYGTTSVPELIGVTGTNGKTTTTTSPMGCSRPWATAPPSSAPWPSSSPVTPSRA